MGNGIFELDFCHRFSFSVGDYH